MKNVKNTFLKETAIEKTLEAMGEIVSFLEKAGHDVDSVIFEDEDEVRRARCRGVIREIDGYYIGALFGIDYKRSRYARYQEGSENFFPVLEMRVYDRKNTYTNLRTSNIVKKIEDVLSAEKNKEVIKKKRKEAVELKINCFNSAKSAVEVLNDKTYIDEFTTNSGIVTPLDATRVKLTASLTVEELEAVNELIAGIRKRIQKKL